MDPITDDAREREAAANLALLASGASNDPSVLAAAVAAAAAATRPGLSPLASPAASVSSTASAPALASAHRSAVASPAKVSQPQASSTTPSLTSSPVPPASIAPGTPPSSTPTAAGTLPASSSVNLSSSVDSPLNHDEASLDGEQFEPILSDEDIEDDGQVCLSASVFFIVDLCEVVENVFEFVNMKIQFQDMEYFTEETEELVKIFNPFQLELQPLVVRPSSIFLFFSFWQSCFSPVLLYMYLFQFLKDPSISPCEAEFIRKYQKQSKSECKKDSKLGLKSSTEGSSEAEVIPELIPDETRRLEEVVLLFEDLTNKKEVTEHWVHAAEQACNVILPGLSYTQKRIGNMCSILLLTLFAQFISLYFILKS